MSTPYLTSNSTWSLLQHPLSQFIFSFLIFLKKLFLKDLLFILFCLWVLCLHVCLHTTCMPGVGRGQKRPWKPWHWSYSLLWTTMRVWSHPLEHAQPTSGHTPREMTPPSEAIDSVAPQPAVGAGESLPALFWDVNGLIFHRSLAGNHSCCAFVSAAATSYPEDSISKCKMWSV